MEAGIRYLPLYPDDPDVLFNEPFFGRADNVLQEMLPESAHLAEVVRVIDVPERTGGKVLRVLMNADLDEAVAVLSDPSDQPALTDQPEPVVEAPAEDHWRWRLRMAERIATDLDPERFGLAGARQPAFTVRTRGSRRGRPLAGALPAPLRDGSVPSTIGAWNVSFP